MELDFLNANSAWSLTEYTQNNPVNQNQKQESSESLSVAGSDSDGECTNRRNLLSNKVNMCLNTE